MTMNDPRSPKEEVATRQGTKQRMNVRVLATSLVLIAIIFAGLYLMFLASPHSQNQGTASDQSRPQTPTVPVPAPTAPPQPQ